MVGHARGSVAAARRRLLLYAALPIAYIVAGRLGLLLAVPPGYATAVFLPAGIAVAAMFMAGAATLPGTFLGSFLLNVWVGYSIAHRLDLSGVATALLIAFASTLQAAVGGAALRRVIGYPAALDTPRDVLLFLLLSAVVCVTSATLSLGGLWALGAVEPADLPHNWLTWWVGDALGVVVALPLMLVLAGEPRPLWRSRVRFVAVPTILCFALFVAIFVRVSKWENEQTLLEFRMKSQHVAEAMKAALDEQALFLEQLSGVFANRRDALTRADFHGLVQSLLQRFPTVQAVEWAPRVSAAGREAFEAAQRADLPGFAMRERDSSGGLRPAGDRDQLYPVTFLEPLSGNEEAAGFDLASAADRRAAIDLAITSGNVTATAPIRLVQEREGQTGILLAHAVSGGPTGPGIVLVVLRMGTFAAVRADPLQATLRLRVADAAGSQPFFDDIPASSSASYATSFDFGTRRYVVQTAPSAVYLEQHRAWQSWAVLVAGTLGAGLLGALLMLGTGHAYRVERLADRLRESEARKSAILESALDAVIAMDQDGRIIDFNPAAEQLFGHRREDVLGKTVADKIIPERLRDVHWRGLRALVATGHGKVLGRRVEMPALRADGTEFASELAVSTTRLEDGQVMFTAYLRDISERKRSEEALRAREAELELIIYRTPFMLIRLSRDLRYRFISQAYAEMIGRRPEDVVGKPIVEILGEEGFQTVRPHIERVLQGHRVEFEREVQFQGLGKRFLHVVYTPDKDERGAVQGWIASVLDVTERKRAESLRDLLVAELSHRVKNTLATVISIAHQSFARGRSLDEARRSFDNRIRALAQTHARLAEASWSGISLATIIRDETAPYENEGSNVLISGPDITLNPKCAVSLGMAIHELTTNAAKYGALSTRSGSLEVAWETAPSADNVRINWIETDGPTVTPPQHSGFGRLLLEGALASDLNGTVKLDFAKAGLKCVIAFPLDRSPTGPVDTRMLERAPGLALEPVAADRAPPMLTKRGGGTSILIVEDEFLLALELEEHLRSSGFKTLGPFSDLDRAEQAAGREPVDLAVLDANLNGKMVYPLADVLSARGIPFIFVTGYTASDLPERFRATPRIAKPYDPTALTREIRKALGKASASTASQ